MKITAITRFRNGALLDALRLANISAVELHRISGVSKHRIYRLISLRQKVTELDALKLQIAFGKLGVFLDVEKIWEDGFRGFRKPPTVEQSKDIEGRFLEHYALHQQMLLEDQRDNLADAGSFSDASILLDEVGDPSDKRRRMLSAYFLEGKTLSEAGRDVFGKRVSCEVARQYLHHGLLKLRKICFRDGSPEHIDKVKTIRFAKDKMKKSTW